MILNKKIIVFLCLLLLVSCQTNKVTYEMYKSPEFEINQFDIVGVIANSSKYPLINEFIVSIVNEELNRFGITYTIDRNKLDLILNQINYDGTNYDFKNIKPLNFDDIKIGSIFLNFKDFDFNNKDDLMRIERESETDVEKITTQNKYFRRITTASVTMVLTIIDHNKGKIAKNFKIESFSKDTNFYFNDEYPEYDLVLGFSEACDKGIIELLKVFSSLILEIELEFKNYEDLFSKGIKYANKKEIPMAVTFFENKIEELKDGEAKSIAYYNLGLCNIFLQNFRKARAYFIKAEKQYKNEDNLRMQEYNRSIQEKFKSNMID